MSETTTLGSFLRTARQDAGLSLAGAARELDLSIDTLRRYERGLTEPTFATVVRIAERYGVTVGDVIKGTES